MDSLFLEVRSQKNYNSELCLYWCATKIRFKKFRRLDDFGIDHCSQQTVPKEKRNREHPRDLENIVLKECAFGEHNQGRSLFYDRLVSIIMHAKETKMYQKRTMKVPVKAVRQHKQRACIEGFKLMGFESGSRTFC